MRIRTVSILTLIVLLTITPIAHAAKPGFGGALGKELGKAIGRLFDPKAREEARQKTYHEKVREPAYEKCKIAISTADSKELLSEEDEKEVVALINELIGKQSPVGKQYESTLHEIYSRLKTGFMNWSLTDDNYELIEEFVRHKAGLPPRSKEIAEQVRQLGAWLLPVIFILVKLAVGVPC